MNSAKTRTILLAATALSMGATAAPAWAQGAPADDEDVIIVTAQRVEERLQDVPVSVSILSSEEITNNGISAARDIATYTPGLTASTRFGNDQTSFTLRGFTQEQRTTATVGVYFADVVSPRGNGVFTGGDGAGPGQMFDLENIQVLKGPQGTLFGRNTSGGAVLLTPTKPKDRFEGYLEGTVGDYNRYRVQGVLNLPVSDTFRVRFSLDRDKRDGYLKNIGFATKYDEDMGSTDYWAFRASAVWDITPDLENYTVGYYVDSKSSGAIPGIERCFDVRNGVRVESTPGVGDGMSNARAAGFFPSGQRACDQITREAAAGGFWTVSNANPEAGSLMEQWQIINRTTWSATDSLDVTGILSYGEHKSNNSVSAFGDFGPLVNPYTGPEQVYEYVGIQDDPRWGWTNAESSMVAELRFSGVAFEDRLNWQGGFYYELNKPIGRSGQQQGLFTSCVDDDALLCNPFNFGLGGPLLSLGRLSYSSYRNRYEDYAAYAQGTFDITDQLAIVAGIRYTVDKNRSNFRLGTIYIASDGDPANAQFACTNPSAPGYDRNGDGVQTTADRWPADARYDDTCTQILSQKTKAPTWTLGLNYKPTEDILLYAKWTRGYRQGYVAPASPDFLQIVDKEKIDTYEVGAKAAWRGSVPGNFNIALYYNDFADQQLQLGVSCEDTLADGSGPDPTYKGACSPTTWLVNAGKSRIYGLEADFMIKPFEGLTLRASYSYLNTKLQKVTIPSLPDEVIYNRVRPLEIGQKLPYSIPHQVNAGIEYRLPFDESVGDITIGGTLVYMDKLFMSSDSDPTDNFYVGEIPSRTFGNVNLTWNNVGGGPVDASVYVTNVTNEKMYTQANDQLSAGFASYSIDLPRMYGLRVKYRFGGLAD